MRSGRILIAAVLGILLSTASSARAGRLELDVAIESGFPVADLQKWNAMLGNCGFDSVRIGSPGGSTARIALDPIPSAAGKSFKVFGVLSRSRELLLPGGRFGVNDAAKISAWGAKVRADGAPLAPGQKRSPFGIEPLTLDLVRKDLGRAAEFSTLKKSPVEVLTEIGNRCQYQVVAEPDIAEALGRAEKVPGELQGLACGTVVAAVLRREGMSLVPALGASGRPEYTIVKATRDQDVWPIGWAPERPVPEILPEMFTLRNVAIDDYAASELLQVVADRLKLPMLFDEQALVLKKLDPSKVKVKIPEGQMGYEAVLDRAMFQSGLKHEVRVDDAGRPFLWITSRTP